MLNTWRANLRVSRIRSAKSESRLGRSLALQDSRPSLPAGGLATASGVKGLPDALDRMRKGSIFRIDLGLMLDPLLLPLRHGTA